MKHSRAHSDAAAGTPSGTMPATDRIAVVTLAEPVSPAGPLPPAWAPPAGPLPPPDALSPKLAPPAGLVPSGGLLSCGELVLSVVCGARDAVAAVSWVPLGDASSDTLTEVIAATAPLQSAAQALMLGATAALEAKRAGSGRAALRDKARMGTRSAKRAVDVSEQLARMPNVARSLTVGDLTPEHADVLADAARRTSPEAVDTAVELLETAAVVAPEQLRSDAQAFVARHDPDAVRSTLKRQRQDRSAALFIDSTTGMGVLNARFDPLSYALVQQAVENYNDALWRRDGTPAQIRDNSQRLLDSVFEMLTNRDALATIDQPVARTPPPPHPHNTDADHDHGHNSDAEPPRNANAEPGHNSDAEPPRNGNAEHDRNRGAGPDAYSDTESGQRGDRARRDRGGDAEPAHSSDAGAEDPAGRSIGRWVPSQAPNRLVIIAEIGVIDGTKPDGLCEALGAGPVPPEILDNLSRDTRINGALFDTNGQVLWLGRSRRHSSAAQHLAIAIRDRGCVLFRAPMHRCDDHHIDEWAADNGTTDMPNLAALCKKCHYEPHNNNQQLQRHHATGEWTTKPRTRTHTADNAAAATAASDNANHAAAARAAGPPHTPRE